MPNYKPPSYSADDLERAVIQLYGRHNSARAVSQYFGIPESTLVKKVAQAQRNKPGSPATIRIKGRRPVIPHEDEKNLADWVTKMAISGYPVSAVALLNKVKIMLDRRGVNSRFADNRPTLSYLRQFRRRHNLSSIIFNCTEKDIMMTPTAPAPTTSYGALR